MLIGLNISLCNPGGWVTLGVTRWFSWRAKLVEFLDTFVDFRHVARRGGPGRERESQFGR